MNLCRATLTLFLCVALMVSPLVRPSLAQDMGGADQAPASLTPSVRPALPQPIPAPVVSALPAVVAQPVTPAASPASSLPQTVVQQPPSLPSASPPPAPPQPQAAAPPPQPLPDGVPTDINPRSFAVAQDIVKTLDMKNLMQGVTASLAQTMTPLIEQENPGQSEKMQVITAGAFQKVMTAHLPELEKNKAIAYAQLFTLPELEQLKKFYGSPAGQKMLQMTPEIMRRNAVLDQFVMTTAFQEVHKQLIEDLKKNGIRIPKGMGA
jgi:hypothetical protein